MSMSSCIMNSTARNRALRCHNIACRANAWHADETTPDHPWSYTGCCLHNQLALYRKRAHTAMAARCYNAHGYDLRLLAMLFWQHSKILRPIDKLACTAAPRQAC